MRPTNARMWHKAVFKVGPVAGPKPTRVRPARPKIPSAPSAFPFLGHLGRQAITPPHERGKSLGGCPPEAGGNLQYRGTPGRTVQR